MGIFCQINLKQPPEGVYHGGDHVSGVVKYAVDEPMEVEKITVSLKGIGRVILRKKAGKHNKRFDGREVYVDTDHILPEGNCTLHGNYEIPFSFRLPEKIPSSIEYTKCHSPYRVKCYIKYYVRLKFEKPGWFTFDNHFRKKLTVASPVAPEMSMEPIIYGERSQLLQLFSSKTSTLIMKAEILNSVIPKGGKIQIKSEIQNDTNIVVNSVKIQLMEVIKVKARGHEEVKFYDEIPECESKTGTIQSEATQIMPIDIIVPDNRISLQNSEIISRNFVVKITVDLPMPHRDVVLEIPVQIGDYYERDNLSPDLPDKNWMSRVGDVGAASASAADDPPPTYWEAMGEGKKDDESSTDDDSDDEKKRKS
ncbi:arrestin domain-containing protein 17-like [Spodoptera frugiperda]|uniref:Arrestin domain-containing protein 17-like n=1 Tax=Spodoptera frugiperda TaxID=7108 RepID=A0A9R0CZ06_SPOFR|nr:arrestin domain-containing protein 17-like [Spodoptera frugiperda]